MSDPQIYVRGFPKNYREGELKQLFGKFGAIQEVRVIRDYAFIVYSNNEEVDNAVKQMDGLNHQDCKLRVQVAGRPKKAKGPQPNDQCRYCRKLGHWQNDCPEYRQKRRRRRRSYSSSSSSSSSDSQRSRRKRRKGKKIKKKSKKRSQSSSSSSSSNSSSSQSSPEKKNNKPDRRQKSKQQVEK